MVTLWLTACGPRHTAHDAPTPDESLTEKRERIRSEIYPLLDPVSGWPNPHDCDGLLWAGLASAAGLSPNLGLAEYTPGEMHRRPESYGKCYPEDSKSEISNDMLLGYIWGADRAALERLSAYGAANNWVMGEGTLTRTKMSENLKGILGRALGTANRAIPPVYLPVAEDYERHLAALGILKFGELDGSISDAMLTRLREMQLAEPDNALYAGALDRFLGTRDCVGILLQDQIVPSYVRGENLEALARVEWLFAAAICLGDA